MATLKVLHLSSERTWRGGEQQIAYLIEELTKLGVSNYAAVKAHSVFEAHCKKNVVPYFALPFKNSIDLGTALQIKDICKRNRIDVVHMHSSKSHGIGVLSALLGNRTPLVLSRRVNFTPKNSWFTKWKYNHPAIQKIICISDKINSNMRRYVRQPEKCVTVYSGIDLLKFNSALSKNTLRTEYNIAEDIKLIGNTSALEAEKDYETYIDTIGLLIRDSIKVKAFIIGKGSLEQRLKQQVAAAGLQEAILFTGFRTDIVNLVPSLDLFLMTSNEEGLGTSILDAFAAGVPVVATAAGGIPEMVKHDETGLLAPVGEATMLADHVKKILGDDHLRRRLIEGASQKLKEFSKEVTAKKTLQIYKDVLNI